MYMGGRDRKEVESNEPENARPGGVLEHDPTDGKIPENIRNAIDDVAARLSRLPDAADLGADMTLICEDGNPSDYTITL